MVAVFIERMNEAMSRTRTTSVNPLPIILCSSTIRNCTTLTLRLSLPISAEDITPPVPSGRST